MIRKKHKIAKLKDDVKHLNQRIIDMQYDHQVEINEIESKFLKDRMHYRAKILKLEDKEKHFSKSSMLLQEKFDEKVEELKKYEELAKAVNRFNEK